MTNSINVKPIKYIPNAQGSPSAPSEPHSRSTFQTVVLFTIFGCSSSWSLVNAFWCELSWFETSQPEGVELAAWLALMQAVGAVIVVCFVYIDTYLLCSKRLIVYVISTLSVLMSLVLAFTWDVTINGSSVFLMIGSVVSGIIGGVQWVVIIPWLVTNYNPRMISPFMAGDGVMTLILVIMEIIQQPGGSQIFSPKVFYLIAAVFYAGSVGAGVYILQNGVERITPERGDSVQTLAPWQTDICLQLFPVGWRQAKRYLFIDMWLTLLTWWTVPVILPYAASNTTDSSTNAGENFLQWAIAFGLLMMFVGYQSSYLATKNFCIVECAILSTLISLTIFLAALDVGNWTSWTMRTILIAAVGLNRLLFGWSVTLLFREIKLKFPENGEAISRFATIWMIMASVIVMTVVWWLIWSGVID